jgi:hypothetical protein
MGGGGGLNLTGMHELAREIYMPKSPHIISIKIKFARALEYQI